MSEPTVLTRHEAVWQWLQTCPHIGDLFFNASRANDGDTQMIPSEDIIQKFIDGSDLRYYDVALTRFMAYSFDPNDMANVERLIDFDAISDWIEGRFDAEDLPTFPPNCIIEDISVLPNSSGWVQAQDDTIMKYMIQFRIEYIHEIPDASASENNN